MDRYSILIGISIVSLIFDNIPKMLQLNTISSGFANKLTWYSLSLLFLLRLIELYTGKIKFEIQERQKLKYLAFLLCVFLISSIHGLLIYPYYDAILSGPISQIEKLPRLLQFFQQHNITISAQNLLVGWIGIRAVKGTISYVLYTFGFSFILYIILKKKYPVYLSLLYKCVTVTVCILSVYSCIELLYLAGNPFAKFILMKINPLLHTTAIQHGWWPPLLWKNQLRSVFSEPSQMGNYAGFALPFLWLQILKAKKILTPELILTVFYTFLIFMTKARTPVAMYWGLFILFVFMSIFLTRKIYLKRVIIIFGISVFSLLLSVGFIKNFMQQQHQKTVTVESYLSDNVGSLTKKNARSNGARYARIRSNLKTGIEHPLFGVGNQLTSSYTVHNFNEYDLQNQEVQLWVRSFNEQGPLKYSLDALNEYVSKFAQYGIIGLITFLLPLFYIFLKLLRKLKQTTGYDQLDTLAITLSLIGSAVAGCNGSLIWLYTYWIILAYAYADIYQETTEI